MSCAQRRRDLLKLKGSLVEVETIREIVCVGISEAERGEVEDLLDKIQDASEVVCDVRDIPSLGVRRDHDQRHPEAVDVA